MNAFDDEEELGRDDFDLEDVGDDRLGLPDPDEGMPGSLTSDLENFELDAPVTQDRIESELAMTRDILSASRLLNRPMARYIVRSYYAQQRVRIIASSRLKAYGDMGTPADVLKWDFTNLKKRENNLKRALAAFAEEWRFSTWAQSVCGIGPVITAGLLAHLDIREAPTSGQFFRFAGLDPSFVWLGKEGARKTVKQIAGDSDTLDGEQWLEISKVTNRNVDRIQRLMPEGKKNSVSECIKVLAKRPWNGALKTLIAFKIGESFVKVQNKESDYYGHMYAQRKAIELGRNDRGDYADIARHILETRRIGKSTPTYACLIEGRLSPAHVHARARRWAAKLFLSHVHQTMYEDFYDREAPKPYAFTDRCEGEHRHFLEPPGWKRDLKGRPLVELLGR